MTQSNADDQLRRVSKVTRILRGALAAAVLSIMILLLLRVSPTLAFCPEPNPPRICAEFFNSEAIFIGRVTSVRYVPEGLPGRDPGWIYTLQVDRTFRGPTKKSTEVVTEQNSGGRQLRTGQTYLLFAQKIGEELEVYGCGNSSELKNAGPTVAKLEALLRTMARGTGGRIYGYITRANLPTKGGLGGIPIAVLGEERTYKTMTREDGTFVLDVPAGKYSVEVEGSASTAIHPYALSYNLPDHVVIHDGGCAEVMFEATMH